MTQEIAILKLVCQKLYENQIPYMLTGSFAANFYAVPRMTRDIDIVVEIVASDASRFFQIFQDDFYIDMNAIEEAVKHEDMFNIIHMNSVFKVDFVIRKKSIYRVVEFQRRRQIELDQMSLWIVSPEDLILSKLHWSKDSLSDFQLRDVKNLLDSVKDLDKKYLDQWVQKLGLDAVYERALANG